MRTCESVSSCYYGNPIFRVAPQSGVMLIKELKHFILKLVQRVGQEEASGSWAGLGWAAHAGLPRPTTLLFNLLDIRGPEGDLPHGGSGHPC